MGKYSALTLRLVVTNPDQRVRTRGFKAGPVRPSEIASHELCGILGGIKALMPLHEGKAVIIGAASFSCSASNPTRLFPWRWTKQVSPGWGTVLAGAL